MTPRASQYVIIWEFRVRPEFEVEFVRTYGPQGAWATLFERSTKFVGSELLHDESTPSRYLTVDRWVSADDFEAFKRDHAVDYARLDAHCDAWTETETAMGSWLVVGGG